MENQFTLFRDQRSAISVLEFRESMQDHCSPQQHNHQLPAGRTIIGHPSPTTACNSFAAPSRNGEPETSVSEFLTLATLQERCTSPNYPENDAIYVVDKCRRACINARPAPKNCRCRNSTGIRESTKSLNTLTSLHYAPQLPADQTRGFTSPARLCWLPLFVATRVGSSCWIQMKSRSDPGIVDSPRSTSQWAHAMG